MGVPVLAPDVQNSLWKFSVREGAVLFGLGAIKNVGEEAVRELVAAREADGPFFSLLDLCCRVPLRKMTRRVLESLIKSGACDCFGVSRSGLLASLESVTARAQKKIKEQDSGQMSLFSIAPESTQPQAHMPGIGFDCPEASMPEWDHDIYARSEKEALGFYLTSHPLQPYRKEMIRQQLTPLEDCRELSPEESFKCAVLAQVDKLRFDSKNRRWALLRVEDLTASGMAFCFSDAYEQYKDLLLSDTPLYMEGKMSRPREEDQVDTPEGEDAPLKEIKFIVEKIMLLSDACAAAAEPVCIDVSGSGDARERFEQLRNVLGKHKGQVPVHLMLHLGDSWCRMELSPSFSVTPGPFLDKDLGLWSGTGAAPGVVAK